MTILDSLVVGQLIEGGSDERVICFVKLPDGAALGARLRKAIVSEVRAKRTARHVPAEVRSSAVALEYGQHQLTDTLPAAHIVRAYPAADRASACRTIYTEWQEGRGACAQGMYARFFHLEPAVTRGWAVLRVRAGFGGVPGEC